MKKGISFLLLFIIIFSNSISAFAFGLGGGNELHFMRSRVDLQNKTIKLDIIPSTEPDRSAKNHNEAKYGDYNFLKTDKSLSYIVPDVDLYHSSFNTERNFSGKSLPNGQTIKVEDGIVQFAGKGDNFIFSFPSDGKSNISAGEKRFAKSTVHTMNDSIDKITKVVTKGNGFKTKDEFLQFWSDFVSSNSSSGTIRVGDINYNYYIGNPNGTIYDKKTDVQTIKNSMYYNYDKDKDGNIMIYIWTGNKNLNEMKDMDFLNVQSFVYAIPNTYHVSNSSKSERLKESSTEYYTVRMFVMQALLNYKLKYESVEENTVQIGESKSNPFTWINKTFASGINSITSWLISFANTYEIVTYKFLTIEFFRYTNPIKYFMILILILIGVLLFAFYVGKFTLTTIMNNISLHIKNLQSFGPLMNYLFMSGLTLSFLTPTIFLSRKLGLIFYDILPMIDLFALGTADNIGGALGELVIAILFTIVAFYQLFMFFYGVLYSLFGSLILLENLKAGRTNYSYLVTTFSYLLFIPFSTLLFTLVLGIASTLAINNWVAFFILSVVGIAFLKELVGKLGLTGLQGMMGVSKQILGYGSGAMKTGAMVAGAVAGGQGTGAKSTGGYSAGSLGGASSGIGAGSLIGGANDLEQTISSNSNNLGARQSMERAEHVGRLDSIGNTFREAKDSIGREYASHLEDIKAGKEYRGKEFKESGWNKADAGFRTGFNIAKTGAGKALRTGAGALSTGLSLAGGAMDATGGILGGDPSQFSRGLGQMTEGGFEAVGAVRSGIQGVKDYASHANASQEFKNHIASKSEGGNEGLEGRIYSTTDPNFVEKPINMQMFRNQGLASVTHGSNGSIVLQYDQSKLTPENKKLLNELGYQQFNGNHKVLKEMGIRNVNLDPNNNFASIEISNPNKALKHMGINTMNYDSNTDQLSIGKNTNDPSPTTIIPKIPEKPYKRPKNNKTTTEIESVSDNNSTAKVNATQNTSMLPNVYIDPSPDYIAPTNKDNYKQNISIGSTLSLSSPNIPPNNPLNDLKPINELKATFKTTTVKPPNFNKRAN